MSRGGCNSSLEAESKPRPESSIGLGVLSAPARTPRSGVDITLQGARRGALTGSDGRFMVAGVPPGQYNLSATLLGYRRVVLFELEVTPVKPLEVDRLESPNLTFEGNCIAVAQ